MKSHRLTEHGFTDTDKKTTNVESGLVESSCLAGCGDGPNHSTAGDRSRRKELLGQESTGDLLKDVRRETRAALS